MHVLSGDAGLLLSMHWRPEAGLRKWSPEGGVHSSLLLQFLQLIRNLQVINSLPQPQPKEALMSLDQARAFIEKMKSDGAFRDRIMAIEAVDACLLYTSPSPRD